MPICFDCETQTDDFVMETRQVSGPGQNDPPFTYSGDFAQKPVHRDRAVCIAKREAKRQVEIYQQIQRELKGLRKTQDELNKLVLHLQTFEKKGASSAKQFEDWQRKLPRSSRELMAIHAFDFD